MLVTIQLDEVTTLSKLKEYHKEQVRIFRDCFWNDLDTQSLINMETGADNTAVKTKKQQLRDVTSNFSDVDAATSEAEIRNLWPTSVLGNIIYPEIGNLS